MKILNENLMDIETFFFKFNRNLEKKYNLNVMENNIK